MAKIKKKTPKGQMQPEEEIRSIAHSIADIYRTYRNQFNAALTVIAVAAVVMIGYALISANKAKQAGQMLEAALQSAEPGGGAPVNYPLALQRLQDVVKQYGATLSGAVAQYEIGNTYAQMGQYEQAVKEYEKFLVQYGKERFLLPFVYQRLGYACLSLGKQADAVKAFSNAEAAGGPGPATVELARIYDREGKTEEAQKKYKEVSEKLAMTSWALEARTKLPPPVLTSPVTMPAATGGK
jgi:tetratricopeptide (TPR) repeat protein